eukprot:CAMPEP_0178462536 /NCGR_PEP_ID=MMETSP0689_2-20121128/49873_1 /TAXON_ID=160604 /ORGANISM="Amphidinium massartii, Strain CS-259" /LENGTH=33 /DNA_ID= /DNA_START= /DNA_END= /DNA_ORIENTATION=
MRLELADEALVIDNGLSQAPSTPLAGSPKQHGQ